MLFLLLGWLEVLKHTVSRLSHLSMKVNFIDFSLMVMIQPKM